MSEELIIGNMSVEMSNPGNSLVDADGLVRNFNRMLLDADEQRQMLADAHDWEKLAHGLASFRSMKAALDVLIRSIEDDVAAHLPDKKVPVQGLGLLERRSTVTRKWDSENLLQHIVRTTLDPEYTGEVVYENIYDLITTLKAVLPFTPSLGWRVTALKEIDVPIDKFSESTYGRQTITITK